MPLKSAKPLGCRNISSATEPRYIAPIVVISLHAMIHLPEDLNVSKPARKSSIVDGDAATEVKFKYSPSTSSSSAASSRPFKISSNPNPVSDPNPPISMAEPPAPRSMMGPFNFMTNTVGSSSPCSSSMSSDSNAEANPPTKAPTKTKIKMVPLINSAADAPTKEERVFFKNDMDIFLSESKLTFSPQALPKCMEVFDSIRWN